MSKSNRNRAILVTLGLVVLMVIMAFTVLIGYSGGIFTTRAEEKTVSQVPTIAQTASPSPTTALQTAQPSTAATAAPEPLAKPGRFITVSTVGQVQATPDVAYLSVGSQVQAPTAREALDKAKAAGDKVSKALVEAGIPEKDIRTSNINAYPVYPTGKDGNPALEPTSYRGYINLSVTITDLSKSGVALDVSTKAGANQVGGVTYAIKDDTALRAQALEQAVKQAKPKAEATARGLGVQVGEVLTVVEDQNGYYPPQSPQYGGKGDSGINPGQLTVGVRVTVSYAIL